MTLDALLTRMFGEPGGFLPAEVPMALPTNAQIAAQLTRIEAKVEALAASLDLAGRIDRLEARIGELAAEPGRLGALGAELSRDAADLAAAAEATK